MVFYDLLGDYKKFIKFSKVSLSFHSNSLSWSCVSFFLSLHWLRYKRKMRIIFLWKTKKLHSRIKATGFYASSKGCSSALDLFYRVSAAGRWQQYLVFMNELFLFLAHITKNFKENVLFFIPVGLGGLPEFSCYPLLSAFYLANLKRSCYGSSLAVLLERFLRYGKKREKRSRYQRLYNYLR